MLKKLRLESADTVFSSHPIIQLQQQNIVIAGAELEVNKQTRKPNFEGRFFSQRLYATTPYYSGFSVKVGIPLFGKSSYKNSMNAAGLEQQYQQAILGYQKQAVSIEYKTTYLQIQKSMELLDYYESTGLTQAEAIIKAANLSYRGGEISFAELSQFLSQAIDIQRNYLDVLNQYNQSVIQLNYYLNR